MAKTRKPAGGRKPTRKPKPGTAASKSGSK